MFDSLIKFVRDASPEDLVAIEIEEMALVSAWYESYRNHPDILAEHREVPEKIDYWLAHSSEVQIQTEGRRLQPLLREVLDRAVEEGADKLNRSELDLLCHARELIVRHPEPVRFDRLATFFSREYGPIAKARKATDPLPGLEGFGDGLRIVTPEDILGANRRSVSTFAGLKMPGRGPVLHHKGSIKVMGYVPDDCMLVAEDGSCLIHGFVFGRVAATHDCEVRDNIAGTVVVSMGDIRCRNALTNAFVVSKWGQVVLRRTERVKLLFGGRSIHIKEDADGGCYAAPDIVVDGIVRGGEYTVSQSMRAERFEQAPGVETIVSLRRSITPEDYGGLTDPIASRLLGAIRRVRLQKESVNERIRMADAERRQFATNAIQFMTGGDALLQGLEAIVKQEHRLSLCTHVISALKSLARAIEHQMSASITDLEGADDDGVRDAPTLVRDLKRELAELLEHADTDYGKDAVADEQGRMEVLVSELAGAETDPGLATEFLLSLRDRITPWEETRGKLIESLERKMTAMEKLLGTTDVRAKNAQLSELKVLARILQAATKRPPGDVMAARSQSSFVKLMLRQIEARGDRIRQFQKNLDELDAELVKLGERLQTEAKIPLPEERTEFDAPPQVEGRFDSGVIICTDKSLLEEARTADSASIVTANSGTQRHTYVRIHNRVALHSEESASH